MNKFINRLCSEDLKVQQKCKYARSKIYFKFFSDCATQLVNKKIIFFLNFNLCILTSLT